MGLETARRLRRGTREGGSHAIGQHLEHRNSAGQIERIERVERVEREGRVFEEGEERVDCAEDAEEEGAVSSFDGALEEAEEVDVRLGGGSVFPGVARERGNGGERGGRADGGVKER